MKIAFESEAALTELYAEKNKATNLTVNFVEDKSASITRAIYHPYQRFDNHELVGVHKWNEDFHMIPLREALIFKMDNGLKALIPYVSNAVISRGYVLYRNMDHTPFTGLSTDLLGWQHFLNVKVAYQIEAMKE